MKRIRLWRRPLLLGFACALAPLGPVWAEGQAESSPTEQKMLDAATQKLDYVKQLIQFDESQIALGNLALQRSHEMRVRGLAQNLVTAHTQHLAELSTWARSRAQEMRDLAGSSQPQGVGGAGTAGTVTPPAQAPGAEGVEQTQPVAGQSTGMASVASSLDAYAQRAGQHRASLPKDFADLQKESGNSFDRKWLDAVGDTEKKGADLVKDGIDKYTSDATFALFLSRTDRLLQSNLRTTKQIAPGLE